MLQLIRNLWARTPARFALGLGFAAALIAACSPSTATKSGGGELNVYSARHYDADEQLYALFEKETGIRLNRIEMKGDLLLERLAAEGASSPADVVLLVDAGNYWRAEERKLLQPVASSVLDAAIPARLRDKDNLWFGIAKRARVIVYDKAAIRPEQVATYQQLADPSLRGKVCVRSSGNVYNLSLMGQLIEQWGAPAAETWAKGVVANFARQPEGGDTDQIKAIADGKCAVALVNHYYLLRMIRSGTDAEKAQAAKVALSFPDQTGSDPARIGAHVNISGAALAANAPNRENAVRFLEFLVSTPAQAILAEANDEFPVVASAAVSNPELKALEGFKESPVALDVYGVRQAEAQQVFDRAGWR